MSPEMIALVLIALEIGAGFVASYWLILKVVTALVAIDERSERALGATERIAQYLAAGPRR